MTTTAAQVLARADFAYGTQTTGDVPADHFIAMVDLDGVYFEYLFPGGAWDISGDAIALGRIRRIGNGPEFRATRPDGTVALMAGYREDALAALTVAASTAPANLVNPSATEVHYANRAQVNKPACVPTTTVSFLRTGRRVTCPDCLAP